MSGGRAAANDNHCIRSDAMLNVVSLATDVFAGLLAHLETRGLITRRTVANLIRQSCEDLFAETRRERSEIAAALQIADHLNPRETMRWTPIIFEGARMSEGASGGTPPSW